MLNNFNYLFVFVYKIGGHSAVNVKDEYDKVVKFYVELRDKLLENQVRVPAFRNLKRERVRVFQIF